MNKKDYIWVEKYRPETVDDCIVPNHIKDYFHKVVESSKLQHLLLFSATPGTGKTTMAKAVCKELGCDYIIINGSDEGRLIETVRNKIRQFASTTSLEIGRPKVIIVDEADGLKADIVQPALRAGIEEYSSNCRFICTANYPYKLIEPIRSRLQKIEFSIPKEEKKEILVKQIKKCCEILDLEGIAYHKRYLAEFVAKSFPDMRTTINGLEFYASYSDNGIDEGILHLVTSSLEEYIKALKNKDYTAARKWLAQTEPSSGFYSQLLNELHKKIDDSSLAQVILIVGDYAYKHAFVADPQVNLSAMTVEIMARATWK